MTAELRLDHRELLFMLGFGQPQIRSVEESDLSPLRAKGERAISSLADGGVRVPRCAHACRVCRPQ